VGGAARTVGRVQRVARPPAHAHDLQGVPASPRPGGWVDGVARESTLRRSVDSVTRPTRLHVGGHARARGGRETV